MHSYNSTEEVIVEILAWITAAVLWCLFWWFVISKMGFKGKVRWAWLVGMCIPVANAFVWFVMLLCPWPAVSQVQPLKIRLDISEKDLESTRKELLAAQAQVNRNVEYIKNVNQQVQVLRQQVIAQSSKTGDPEIDRLQEKLNQLREKRKREKGR